MAKDKISDYSATANSNTDIAGINIDEGCAPSGINDAIRTLMKQLKDWQSGSQDIYIHPAGSAAAPSITTTGDTNTGVFFPAADTVGISTGGTERARVDSSGNLGLGVTPSAWSGSKVIEFQNGQSLNSFSNTLYVGGNTYYNGTNYIAKTTAGASLYGVGQGTHIWYNAASVSAGSTQSFTQAMTLDASGNLGIGLTSPTPRSGGGAGVLDANGPVLSRGAIAVDQTNAAVFQYNSNEASIRAYGATSNSGFITFRTGGGGSSDTERARIDSSGNLLVGTTSGSARVGITGSGVCLDANSGTTTAGTQVASFTKALNSTATSNVFVQFNINGGAAGSGQINANGSSQAAFGSFSDQRLKENIVDLQPQLSKVLALRPVEFDYIETEGGGHQTGFIAQEMQEVFPDAVGERTDGMLTITGWNKTEAILVKAIQELNAKFEAYKAAHP